MAQAKTTAAAKKTRRKLPDVSHVGFTADKEFRPLSARAADNPFREAILDAPVGVFFVFPDGLSEDELTSVKTKVRSAGEALRLSIHFRQDDSGRWAWKVAGPIQSRPRKNK